jgi:hypothetical protein
MTRVLRCDGVVPQYDLGEREPSPGDVREMSRWLEERGARPDLDVISEGETPLNDARTAAEIVAPWADAGCTWWLETRWEMPHHTADRMAEVRDRLEAGPPRLR